MQIIFSQADVKAIKTTVLAISRDARTMPLPEGGREAIRRIIREAEAFGPKEVADLAAQFDAAHLHIEMTPECGISITLSTDALQAQLGLAEQYYELAFDLIGIAMPMIRVVKKFANRIKASASAAAEMLVAKKPADAAARGSWETVDADVRAAEAADLARRRGEQQTDWSAA